MFDGYLLPVVVGVVGVIGVAVVVGGRGALVFARIFKRPFNSLILYPSADGILLDANR